MHDRLLERILRRKESLFRQDMEDHLRELTDRISRARVLVIGAAGSIGSAFVKELVPFAPSALHLVDTSENNLVEVVRDLRSSDLGVPQDFRTCAIGLGTAEFDAFLADQQGYDYIMNFSALKHVRSERDPYTLMRMVHTNVYAVDRLLRALAGGSVKNFFSVSSDKAVNPASVMGATKAFMERIMFLHSPRVPCSTSRFANVAFSDGSLLFGFYKRLEKRQPLSAPSDVKRYFISYEEAGTLCLMSCFLGGNRDINFPRLDEALDMYTFSEIAEMFLESRGLRPVVLPSEDAAREAARRCTDASREWPCYFSTSDTTGEKPYEEFCTSGDNVDFASYRHIGLIHNAPLSGSAAEATAGALEAIGELRDRGRWTKREIVRRIQEAVPELQHDEKEKNLDEKM